MNTPPIECAEGPRLPADVVARLLALANAQPDQEICGLLAAREGEVTRLIPVVNSDPSPTTRFTMDPAGQIAAMRHMREQREELYAIYHSHPRGPAQPSAADRAQATYPRAWYLIIGWGGGDTPHIRAFRMGNGDFREYPVIPATSVGQDGPDVITS